MRWRLPAVIGDVLVMIWVSIVPVPSLGCLLGRDVLDALCKEDHSLRLSELGCIAP